MRMETHALSQPPKPLLFWGGGLKHPLGCLELFYIRVRFKIFNFYVANVQSLFERKCFFNKKFVPKNVKFGTKA